MSRPFLSKIGRLREYARKHYNSWGHWFVETYSPTDFEVILYEAKGDESLALERLEELGELWNARAYEERDTW